MRHHSNYIAHIREGDGAEQTVKEHLEETATRARAFGDNFNNGDAAYLCGLFHDIGKFSQAFQKRIRGETNRRIDHSTAGAKELNNRYANMGRMLAYCVAGHHAGLPDGGSFASTSDESALLGRLKREIEPYAHFSKYITLPDAKKLAVSIVTLDKMGFSVSFYCRMLFSCLVDADFIDTECFMSGKARATAYDTMEALNQRIDSKIAAFTNQKRDIDVRRTQILKSCIGKAKRSRGLYTLTVPTGGGKTITSIAFAIKHALHHGMDRVIYVIPYNSIIEQNAAEFKKILGEQNVLEHHSGIYYDESDESVLGKRLATENWDMPVVVTTTVQFFESLFANRTSKCRKLHSIANSVIIFDEAQLLPINYLKPCVRAISELVYNYKSTCVLCSATQPALEKQFPPEIKSTELCDNIMDHNGFFKRTCLQHIGELSDAELAMRLNGEKQVLCIVSTRKQAQNIFYLLNGDEVFHLSTFMYPVHRRKVLADIKDRLKSGKTCRVVSTSLIEAGVDVDFPVVYRAEAGLDSLIQATGRCNREGKNPISPAYVFKPEQAYRKSLPDMLRRPIAVTSSVMSRFEDLESSEAIQAYFEELYSVEGEALDKQKIVKRFEEGIDGMNFPFAQVAGEFRLIDNATRAIIIPGTEEARALVERLRADDRTRGLLRSVQQYTVNVYEKNYDALRRAGSINVLDAELAVLVDLNKYDKNTGLDAGTDSGQAIFV